MVVAEPAALLGLGLLAPWERAPEGSLVLVKVACLRRGQEEAAQVLPEKGARWLLPWEMAPEGPRVLV